MNLRAHFDATINRSMDSQNAKTPVGLLKSHCFTLVKAR